MRVGLLPMAAVLVAWVTLNPVSLRASGEIPMSATNLLWEKLRDTTWQHDNGWAGEGYVFYQNNHGSMKCIRQLYGSGVYVASSSFVKITIIDEDHIQIDNKLFELKVDDKLVASDGDKLSLSSKQPSVFGSHGQVDIDLLRNSDDDSEILQSLT
jgi:hypothetical protein